MPVSRAVILACLIATMYPYQYCSERTTSCITKKKIVLDVGKSGLGNRLSAIASAAILCILTNRVLQLEWEKDKSCEEVYDNLFEVQQSAIAGFRPFEIDEKYPGKTATRDASFCRIHLDGVHDRVLHGKVDVG